MKCCSTPFAKHHWSSARPANSGPTDPFVIDSPALALQPIMQPAIAKAPELVRQLAQALPQPLVLALPAAIATGCTPQPHQPAGASLRDRYFRAHHYDRLPPHLRAYHFFATTACNACLSSVRSATRCFSRRFSSSKARRRLASLTSMPPYFAFQRYKLPRVIPCRRHSSPGSTPASPSFRMAIICSSLNRVLRTTPPPGPWVGHPKWEKSHCQWTNFPGAYMDPSRLQERSSTAAVERRRVHISGLIVRSG